KGVTLEQLCEGLPVEFKEYMDIVRNVTYESDPPYRHLRKLFKRCFRREGYKKDFVFDWTTADATSDATSVAGFQSSIGASDSSLSTIEDDGVPRARHDPTSLKRIHDDDDQGADEPPAKRARTDPDPNANVVLISSL